MTQNTRLGDLSMGVGLDFSDADAQLAKYKQHVERETGVKLQIDDRAALSATDRVKRDVEALGELNKKQLTQQGQATRLLGAQYEAARKAIQEQNAATIAASRQDQAAAQARTAQLREQAAQLSLNTRLAAKQRQDERDATRQTLGGIESQVRAYRDLWQARVLSNDQVYAQQGRLREQALSLLLTVDKQSDAYRRLTAVAAAAQRTQDAAMGVNTPGGFGSGISQGITNALGQFGVTGDLIAGFIQMFSAKRAAAQAEASNLGRDTMAGLIAGMKNNQAQVKQTADLAGDSVSEAIRASLDIHSPSRVTEYLGKMAGLGFVTGMKSYQGEAAAAARALGTSAEGGLRNTTTSGGAFGGSGNFDAGNLAASATALAALNQQLAAAQPASEGAAEGAEAAGAAADGLGEAVGGAAEQVKGLRDAHQEQDAASRQAAVNEAQTAIAFTATAAAITAVAAALVVSYNAAADYEAAMNKAKATTDATSQEMAQLDVISKSQNLTDLGINAISAAGGIEELGSQGLNTSQIVGGGLVSSLTLAKAVSSDVAKAASVAAASSKAFGLEADQLGKVADVVTMAVNGTSVKMDNFTEAIAAGGAVAKSQGVNFLEFTAAISLMTDKAIGASDAGTSMKTFLMALTPNSKEATAAMKLLGFSAFDAQGNFKPLGQVVDELRIGFSKLTPEQRAMTAETIFGADGVRAFNILIEAGKQGLLDRVGLLDKNGAATKAAGDKMEGARGEQEKFNAELKNFQISMGENFLPAATKMLEWATSFMRAMKDVNTEYGKFVNGQAAFGAQEYNLPTWLKQSGLRERDLTPDQTKEATRLLREMQFQANETAKNAGQWRRLGMEAQAQNVESEGIKVIGRLGALLGKIQAAASSAPRVQGPVQGDGGATPVDYDSAGNLTQYSGDVLRQTAAKTGKQTADMVVDYCAQWTRLTLGNADKRAQAYIDKLFSGDMDKDGQTTAKDYALKAKAAGLLRTYSSPKDLQPGDVVFYTENGQNHSGIYIGGGMLRGNNRVTYAERGGKFDAKGNPISRGIDPVGDVAIDRLGTANSYIRTSDLGRAAGVTERDPRLAGPTGAAPAIPERTFESYRKEAVQILAQIAKFAPGGTAPDGEKWAEATARLKKFGEMNAVAGQAIQYAQLQMGLAGKEVSKYGQTFDRLKGQLNITESMDKLGQNVVPQLKAIQAEAQKAAATELARNGRTEKYRELLGLAGDAASRLKQIEGRKPEQSPLEREQQTLREANAQDALEKSIRKASATRLRAIVEGGVQREGDLARVQAAQKELDRREELSEKRRKEAQTKAAQVNEAIRQNDIARARAALAELERQRDAGLQKVKGNLVAELAVQRQYADLVYNARKAVLDKEKKDRDADIRNSALPQGVKTVQLATSKTIYDTALAEAAGDRLQRINTAITASAEASAQAQIDAQTRLNASTIEGMRIRQQAADQAEAAAQRALDSAQETGDRIVAGMVAVEQATLNMQATANKGIADDVVARASKLMADEDFGGALQVLQAGLERLMTAALNGEPAAEGIDALVQAFNNLTDARARWRAEEQRIAGVELALTDPLKPTPARVNGSIRDTAAPVPDGGAVDARRTRPAARLNPDGTEYVDPGVAARDPQGAQRAEDWEAVMRAERVDTYRKSLEKLDLSQLEAAKSAAILSKDTARYQMIQDQITRTTEKNAADQATAITQAAQEAENFRQAQLEGARADLEHEHSHNLISERTYLDRKQALDVAAAQAEYDAVKAAHGDLTTAGQVLQNKLTAIQREGSDARRALLISEAQTAVENFQLIAGSLSQLASAIGEGEEEYDRATGKKLQTPWKDVAANLDGAINAAGKLLDIGTDVMKLLANPADVGTWIKLATTVVSSIADAVAGFQKAQAEVRRLKEEFAQDNPFLNAGDYQKAFTRSRGFFADFFGGGPEVVNEIDKVGLKFAQTMQNAFQTGIKNGLSEAIQKNDFSLFSKALHQEVYSGLLEGVIDVFLNETLLKNIIAPAIKAWSDALKTPGTADDEAALAGIDAAVGMVDQQSARFYSDVAPRLQGLQEKWGLTPEDTKGVDTTGLSTAPPAIQYALSTPLLESVTKLDGTIGRLDGTVGTLGGAVQELVTNGIKVTIQQGSSSYQSTTGALAGR